MLKHASPLRSSTRSSDSSAASQSNLFATLPSSPDSLILSSRIAAHHQKTRSDNRTAVSSAQPGMSPLTALASDSSTQGFNERGVDCEGLLPSPTPHRGALTVGMDPVPRTGWGIGPVITHGRAIVRRGLSFTLRRERDVPATTSIKNETRSTSLITTNKDTNMNNLKNVQESSNTICEEASQPTPTELQLYDPNPLRTLLQMPGIHAEVRLPDSAVTSSPTILNPDTMSLNSADSLATSSSGRTSSRSWGSSAAASTSSQSSDASTGSTSENTSVSTSLLLRNLE